MKLSEKNLKKVEKNPVDSYLLSLYSPITVENYKIRLRCFIRFTYDKSDFMSCNWSLFDYDQVQKYVQHLREKGNKFTSINLMISILKGVASFALQQKLISTSDYFGIKHIKPLRGYTLPSGQALTVKQVRHVMRSINTGTYKGMRNYAIFNLAVSAGLRRIEISRLNIEDIYQDHIVAKGKGNKERRVFVGKKCLNAVNAWIKHSKAKHAVFFHASSTHCNPDKRLIPSSIGSSIKGIFKDCDMAGLTAHDCRRTFATSLFEVGADKFAIQKLLGHSCMATTQIYDRTGDKLLIDACNMLPY